MSAQEVMKDRIVAAVDLVGRTGATGFEVGYLHDGVPVAEAGWYAHAQFRGARVIAENHEGPEQAAEALALRLLTGARCRCGKLVALSPGEAFAFFDAKTIDGSSWTAAEAAEAGQCLWQRIGPRWEPSCPVPAGRRGD